MFQQSRDPHDHELGPLLPMARQLWVAPKKVGFGLQKFEPNWAQRQLYAQMYKELQTRGKIRIIVLKARQLGISTATEALAFNFLFLFEHYRAMILANKEKSAQSILNMTKLFWETSPYRHAGYSLKYNSRNDLAWRETWSSIKVATAGRTTENDIGRGDTLAFLHASEVAFWVFPEGVMSSVDQTIAETDGTAIVLESTANGMGNYFERTWKEATAGEIDYTPMFFSWLDHFEYSADFAHIDTSQPMGPTDEEERALSAMGASKDQLVWRRWMIRNKCQGDPLIFAQEYPAIPEQAFIATGTNVFSYPLLRAAYKPQDPVIGRLYRDGQHVTFIPDPTGQMYLYKAPNEADSDWSQYLVAGDPTHRTRVGNDYACAQVINRHTLEQVACYRGRVDPGHFGEELYKLGLYYNKAIVSSEVEGPSSAAIGVLLGMNYPNIYKRARPDSTPGKQGGDIWGWMTTQQSKHFMMGVAKKYLADGDLEIHDAQTFAEMKEYVTDEDGKMRPADSDKGHDDTVMALAQALACHYLEGPMRPYGSAGPDNTPPWGDGAPPWEAWHDQGAA
jgi:hypothetical protein